MTVCNQGHPIREVSRQRIRETTEDVVYRKQMIKKFNREGSEAIVEAEMPEFVERLAEVDVVEYYCDQCQQAQHRRENQVFLT